MFTVFHMFIVLGALLGLVFGADVGRHFGILGGCVGAAAGFFLGIVAGRIPWKISLWLIRRELGAKLTPQLWSDLSSRDCLMPNLVLLELRRRREPMEEGLNLVLSLLTSEERPQRLRGFAALLSAFPKEAERLKDYSPDAPASTRLELVNQIKRSF